MATPWPSPRMRASFTTRTGMRWNPGTPAWCTCTRARSRASWRRAGRESRSFTRTWAEPTARLKTVISGAPSPCEVMSSSSERNDMITTAIHTAWCTSLSATTRGTPPPGGRKSDAPPATSRRATRACFAHKPIPGLPMNSASTWPSTATSSSWVSIPWVSLDFSAPWTFSSERPPAPPGRTARRSPLR